MIFNDKQKTILQSFTRYRSPIDEGSLYKGIDINYLPLFKKQFRDVAETNAKSQSHLLEILNGIETVKSHQWRFFL